MPQIDGCDSFNFVSQWSLALSFEVPDATSWTTTYVVVVCGGWLQREQGDACRVGKVHIKQCRILCGRCDLWHGIEKMRVTSGGKCGGGIKWPSLCYLSPCRRATCCTVPTATAVCGVSGLRQLARICVCGSVSFGSGRNKFVQLLIRSQNTSGWFVWSLKQSIILETLSSFIILHEWLYSSKWFGSFLCQIGWTSNQIQVGFRVFKSIYLVVIFNHWKWYSCTYVSNLYLDSPICCFAVMVKLWVFFVCFINSA